jgi:hypothetical protein
MAIYRGTLILPDKQQFSRYGKQLYSSALLDGVRL